MDLKTVRIEIGNLMHQYYMELPPKHIQEGYTKFMYSSKSLLEAVDKWIEKERERTGK